MDDMPERIWSWKFSGSNAKGAWAKAIVSYAEAEYVRADIVAALRDALDKAEAELLKFEHLRKWGFAPGSYFCFCSDCGKQHNADKRAWRCLDCAEKKETLVEVERDAAWDDAIEAAAVRLEPHNPRDDWTQYAHDMNEAAKLIRALKRGNEDSRAALQGADQ